MTDMLLPFKFGFDASTLAAQIEALSLKVADIQNTQGTIMANITELQREVSETKAQNVVVVEKITHLLSVVQPLMDAVDQARAALAAAQAELATAQNQNAELNAQIAAATAELDATQAVVQPVLDSVPTS